MIALNPTQKKTLTELVKVIPVDDTIKKHWDEAIQAEHTPKHILFDIAMSMEAVEESRSQFAESDKRITGFFNESRNDLKKNDTEIDAKLAEMEKKVKELKQELKTTENTAAPTPNQPSDNSYPPTSPDATI